MTQTSQPTLADFLLARIAEDEARAKPHLDWYDIDNGCFRDEATGQMRSTEDAVHEQAKRVLAECDAKRRIVGYFSADDPRAMAADLLGYLALPYADHPDYRDEWRP